MTRQRAHVWAVVLGGVLAGPVAGGQVVLRAKPFGGVIGVPGTVVGYLALTGVALAVLALPLMLWLLRRITRARMAGVCATAAGAGFVVAGSARTPVVFVAAVLVALAATGPLLILGRAAAPLLGPRGAACWCATVAAGVAVAAGAAAWWPAHPGACLFVAGVAATVSGVVVLVSVPDELRAESTCGAGHVERRILAAYLVLGGTAGAAVLPGLHLMLFRWNVPDTGQARWLMCAAICATLVVLLPGPHIAAIPVLLTLAAGGPVLVASAPGAAALWVGLTVTIAAAARATSGLDQTIVVGSPHVARVAVAARSAAAVVGGGLAGLGMVAGVGRYAGTGSGLTVAAASATLAVLLIRRTSAEVFAQAVRGRVVERGAA